jgi:phage tail sheath gpL-like
MTLTSSVPTSVDTPNSFHEFHHVKQGGSLVALPSRVLLAAVKSAAGTATAETPVQVFDLSDAITKAGQGSELALMCAKAFEQGLINASTGRGGTPEIWICPIAAPGASVAAAQTLTVTVTTAVAGTVVLRIAGRTINVGVAAGDAQNTIAAAIEDAIDAAARELPVTAAVSTNVVTCTHVTTGTNGNDVVYEVVSVPSGVSIASAQSAAGTGTVDITAALDAAVDKNYDAIAVSIHSSTAVSDAAAHLTTMWGYAQKFWRWVFIGDKASLATAQGYATSADSERILVVSCEQSPSLPSEIAAAAAVAAFGIERPNANFDGVELALYPPPTSYAYTAAEVESSIDGGVTPLRPTSSGARLEIVRLVTTKITDGGAPFYALADLAFSRTLAYRATQYDVQYRQRFQQEVIDGDLDDPEATLLARVRDMCVEIDREMGRLTYLRDVEDNIAQIRVEEASSPAGRLLVQAPCRVAGPLHQVAFDHLHYYL